MIRHYYHLWADGDWEQAASEHIEALERSQLDCEMTVGVVGADWRRIAAMVWFGATVEFIEADAGFEDVTLARLWADACASPDDVFLYCHTKGAYHPGVGNDMWRRSMTNRLVYDWQECVPLLTEYDAVGCHWLDAGTAADPYSIFGGNFWWATGRYLATLPQPQPSDNRYEAERWIGRGSPHAFDRLPGQPNYGTPLDTGGNHPWFFWPRQEVAPPTTWDSSENEHSPHLPAL